MTARWRDVGDEERRAVEKREKKVQKALERSIRRGLRDVKRGRVRPWEGGMES